MKYTAYPTRHTLQDFSLTLNATGGYVLQVVGLVAYRRLTLLKAWA